MSSSRAEEQVHQALAMLASLGYPEQSVRVSVVTTDGAIKLVFTSSDPPERRPDKGPSPEGNTTSGTPRYEAHWAMLSSAEDAVVKAFDKLGGQSAWTKSADVAKLAGLDDNSALRVLLHNMMERGILESSPGRGYRLRLPPKPPAGASG